MYYEADDGKNGYALYKEYRPDVLLLDINLPFLNGLDLLAKVRQTDHTTKAIMITGNTNSDFLLKATELKLTKYLVKPVKRVELKEAIALITKEFEQFQTISKKTIRIKENYKWDNTSEILFKEDVVVDLTQLEIKILSYLFKDVSSTVYYESLCFNIWDNYNDKNLNSLKTAIKKLRRKLPEDTIQNIYGIGYKVAVQ